MRPMIVPSIAAAAASARLTGASSSKTTRYWSDATRVSSSMRMKLAGSGAVVQASPRLGPGSIAGGSPTGARPSSSPGVPGVAVEPGPAA